MSLGPQPKSVGEAVLVMDGTSFMLQIGGYVTGLSASAARGMQCGVFAVYVLRGGEVVEEGAEAVTTRISLDSAALTFRGP